MGGIANGRQRDDCGGPSAGAPFNPAVGQMPMGGLMMQPGYVGTSGAPMPMAPWPAQGFGQLFIPAPVDRMEESIRDHPVTTWFDELHGAPIPTQPLSEPSASGGLSMSDRFGQSSTQFAGFPPDTEAAQY